jgi:hypothetical protein
MESIVRRKRNGRYVPILICDACKGEIGDADEAAVIFVKVTGGQASKVRHVHKDCERPDRNRNEAFFGLRDYLRFLYENTDCSEPPAPERRLKAGIASYESHCNSHRHRSRLDETPFCLFLDLDD